MTEREYIIATNRVKISIAKDVVRDVLPGELWGVSDKEMGDVMQILCEVEERLFGLIETKED